MLHQWDFEKVIKLNGTNYELLGIAIVLQAIEDFEKAFKKNDNQMLDEVNIFFDSDWCYMLTGLEGDRLRSMIFKRMADKEPARHKYTARKLS